MNNRDYLRGVVIIAISLAFGLLSLRYPIGQIELSGPGLFPLILSSLLFLIGVATLIRTRFIERVPLQFNVKNIAVIIASLVIFALISQTLNMIVGIIGLVFCASLAASSYSVSRNIKIAAGLIVIALAFQKLLGLQMPLY